MRKNFGVKPWFYPLPVLIIGTYNEDGTPNAMNAAWGGLYAGDQVVLCLSPNHKTTGNLKARGAFTVHFADAAHVVPADYVGLVSGQDQPDKLAKAGLHGEKSPFVDAPLLKEFPVALECKLVKRATSSARSSTSAPTRPFWGPMARLTLPSSVPSPMSPSTTGTMCWESGSAAPSRTGPS